MEERPDHFVIVKMKVYLNSHTLEETLFMIRIYHLIIAALFLFCLPAAGLAFGGMDHQHEDDKAAPTLPQDYTVRLQVPIFSELFAETPVARVGRQPILLGELTPELKEVHKEMPSAIGAPALTQRFNQVLDRLIAEHSEGDEEGEAVVYADRTISEDRVLVVNIPIFDPLFMFTPVASVNEEPIPMGEFAQELGAMHAETEEAVASGQPDNPAELLERLVIVRLVEQEARNMGLDEQGMVKRQVDEFAEKTLLYELLGMQVDEMTLDAEETQVVYKDISLAAKLDDYRIPKQEDAEALRKALKEGANFDALMAKAVKEGKATPGEEDTFIMFKNLLPQVASMASGMEVGEVSSVFRVSNGFAVFRLVDRKFVDDPAALKVAEKITWDQQVADRTKEYLNSVVEQYAVFNEEARNDLNMTRIKEQNPEIKLSKALEQFQDDQRVFVTVDTGEETHTLRVNELIDKLEKMYFHGTDIALNAKEADDRLGKIFQDWIFRLGGTAEAKKLGIDQSLKYTLKVEEFERRTLFDHFMQKIVVPEVKLTEEEIQQYYEENKEEYSTPAMLRLESLAFEDREDALAAFDKLQKGSDFKWVSANTGGLVPSDDENRLAFESGILSLTSLPKKFQESAEGIETGDSILYSDPGSYHYVVYFQKVYPPEPKPYEQVREQILEKLYQEKVKETLMNYVDQLKEHYPTEIYLKVSQG